jgi:hypothetical protein
MSDAEGDWLRVAEGQTAMVDLSAAQPSQGVREELGRCIGDTSEIKSPRAARLQSLLSGF